MSMGVVYALLVSQALAAPPSDLVSQVQAAWQATNSYCADFVFAVHGNKNMAVSKGRTCMEPAKRVLTETESPLGPVVDIRMKGEAWYYDPARPVVVHFISEQGAVAPGEGLGEWVEMLANTGSYTPLEDILIDGRLHWRVSYVLEESGDEVVLMIDREHRLPTAMELRKDGAPLLSNGYVKLAVNPVIPDSYFQIRALVNAPTVEVQWDPNRAPSEVAAEVEAPSAPSGKRRGR
ncbi:MAG: hypothetical protein VX519_00500 [Myxococcota bacterium]|nr:hypothetical protein [Myxococcota bacterium]